MSEPGHLRPNDMIGPLSDKAAKESTMDYPVLVRPGKPS
jgi:hypothetical protein